jgi:hypothetical protein
MYRGWVAEDQKLYREDIAEVLGISVRSMGRLKLPRRDGTDSDRGHARPYWWESTIKLWLPTRPGKGWRKGRDGSREAEPR